MSKFSTLLSQTTIERQVEDLYNEQFKKFFKDITFVNDYNCDALFSFDLEKKNKASVIVEYKYFEDFQKPVARAKALSQILFYLKRFEKNGRRFPNICIVADKNQCFILHSNDLIKFLEFEGVNWDAAPSSASSNAELVLALSEDSSLNPFVFEIDEDFDFKDVYDKIINIAADTKLKLKLTEHSVDNIFKYFTKNLGLQKLQANDAVSLFFGVMTGDENVYLHPTKQNVIVSHGKQIRIDSRKFEMFKDHFNTECSPKEKMRLAAISDRLIEDTSRRRKGEFYTPTVFVDYSQQMITDQLGEDWREKYVVWDPAWGTGNLTRDYHFKELYASTLEQAELEIGAKHNTEATKFKFDFLNDPLENLPAGLLEAFKQDKPVLFYLNPPYGKDRGDMAKKQAHLYELTNTNAKMQMKNDGISAIASNLYLQFLYKITKIKEQYKLTDCRIAVFSPFNFITVPSIRSFKDFFFNRFEYTNGSLFDSKYFDNVNYGSILFSLWKSGKTATEDINASIIDESENGIIEIGAKTIYSITDNLKLNRWFKIKGSKVVDLPNMKNAIQLADESSRLDGKGDADALGYMTYNNAIFDKERVVMLSAPYCHGSAPIFFSNFDRCVAGFAARLICDKNAYNQFDEFLKPDESHSKFNEFINDSLVYCLFSCKSYQSSLRNVEFKGKMYNIHNNFFWMSRSEIEDLADQCNLDDVYVDAHTALDRFVYKKLQGLELSKEAQAVLDKASEFLKKSFKFRKLFSSEHPEYQLDKCWDAGWYQVKGLLKEYMKEELKEFNGLVKTLGDKMRPMVYELGFLKK